MNKLFRQIFLSGAFLLTSFPALAQITPDNTLSTPSRLIRNAVIQGGNADSIEGGTQRGSNLFHSFSEFNIENGQRLYFANPGGVENILTRVTGTTASNIFGTLGVDGTANLFLINPNGILFGANARLDMRGSFIGTTANAIRFGDQGVFSATNPTAPALLTVQPSALLFTQIQTSQIVNQARSSDRVGLTVPRGKSLLLVGGNVLFDGGQMTVPGGRIELGGLAVPGEVGLSQQSDRWQLSFPTTRERADVRLQQDGFLANTGGIDDLVITGRNITAINAPISSVLLKEYATEGQRTGSFIANATGTITTDYSDTREQAFPNGAIADIGSEFFTAENILLKKTLIGGVADSYSNGVSFNASGAIVLDGSFIFAGRKVDANQATGNITLKSQTLNLINGSIIASTSKGDARSGDVNISADTIALDGGAINSLSNGNTDGGNIEIQARSLSLLNGAAISTSSSGTGNSGSLTITASDAIELKGVNPQPITLSDGTSAFQGSYLSASAFGSGNAGKITVNTGRLSILDGGSIASSTNQGGRSGDITINAAGLVEVAGGRGLLVSNIATGSLGDGDAGNILLNAGRLSIRDGANIRTIAIKKNAPSRAGKITIDASDSVEIIGRTDEGNTSSISTATLSAGDAGDVNIRTGLLTIDNGSLLSGSFGNGRANGGNVEIETRGLSVINGGSISTGAYGNSSTGNSGNLTVLAADFIEVSGESPNNIVNLPDGPVRTTSGLSTAIFGSGTGGQLTLNTRQLKVRDGATITTGAGLRSSGRGGTLTINALESIDLSGGSSDKQIRSYIGASTLGFGDSGNLLINTRRLRVRDGAFITTSSDNTTSISRAGNITIEAQESVEVGGRFNGNYSSIDSSTSSAGAAGNITLRTERLALTDGALSSSTFSQGQGGNITVNANTIEATQGGSILSSSIGSGEAGSITLNARDRILLQGVDQDQLSSGLFAVSVGSGSAGNLTVNAPSITISDRAKINVSAASTDGGNITINATDGLLLRRGGGIITNAGNGQAGGNGGNITIDAGAIVAVPAENSDISANAFTGQGGNVRISTQAIFGIQARSQLTDQSDITASSQLGVQGAVSIVQPEVQPTQGVIELPANTLDASNQIAQVCPRGTGDRIGQFTNSGRGSIPLNPIDPLAGAIAPVQLATIEESRTVSESSPTTTPPKLIEAQGWVKAQNGRVVLVAQASQATPTSRPTSANCSEKKQ